MKFIKGFLFTTLALAMFTLVFVNISDKDDPFILNEVEALSYDEETIEFEQTINQGNYSDKLSLYIESLRTLHADLSDQHDIIQEQVSSIKSLKTQFESDGISLTAADKHDVIESLKIIKLNRFMIQETFGDGYAQLMELRDNHIDYTFEEKKDILIDVYHVLNSRLAMYHSIIDELTHIEAILDNY
jgi:hypothetical protein